MNNGKNKLTYVNIYVKSNGKSKFLQNHNFNFKKKLGFCFGVKYNDFYQIYFYEKYVNKNFILYRYSKNYDLKVVYNYKNNNLIGFAFGKNFDSGLSGYYGKKFLSIKNNMIFGFLSNIYIKNNNNDIIYINGYFRGDIILENINKFYLSNYNYDLYNFIKLNIIGKGNTKNIVYNIGFGFFPDINTVQITLLENRNKFINLINYRFIKKDISLVFYRNSLKLKYFYIILDNKPIYLFKDSIKYIGNINFINKNGNYGFLSCDLSIKIGGLTYKLKGCLKVIIYPNL